MGVVRIQDLTAGTTPLSGTEILEVEQGGNSRKVTAQDVANLAPAGFTNPMTTAGDLIRGGTGGAATRVGIGTSGQVLTVVSGLPAWAAAPSGGAVPVQDEGSTIVATPTALNFVGAGVTVTAAGSVATVTIPGGGGGGGGSSDFYHRVGYPRGANIFYVDNTFRRVRRQANGNAPAILNSARSTGLWYYEFFVNAIGINVPTPGLTQTAAPSTAGDVGSNAPSGNFNGGWSLLANSGDKYSGTVASYGSSITTNDVVMVAVNLNTGKIWMGKNGTWFASGNPAAGTNEMFATVAGFVQPAVAIGGNADFTFKVAASELTYSPPSGFSAWAS